MIFDLLDYLIGYLKCCIYLIIYMGRYTFGLTTRFSNKSSIRIYGNSSIRLENNTVVRSGCILRTHNDGVITIGNNSGLNNDCYITALEKVTIGENTIIGQGVKIYDHDHIYGVANIRKSGFNTKPVTIGDNVWIGSNSVILKGAVIGDNAVVAAGSIVTGHIPENSLYIQKRSTTISQL